MTDYEALRKRIREVVEKSHVTYAEIARATGRLSGKTVKDGYIDPKYNFFTQVLSGQPGQKSRPALEDAADYLEQKGFKVRSVAEQK